jgi:predicted nucleic acid-binding protein
VSVVVDSSVVVAALVDVGRHGTWAEQILTSGILLAPELVRAEATSTLRRLERARRIGTREANCAHEDLMQLDLQLFTFDPFADRIWELRHSVTSYDA